MRARPKVDALKPLLAVIAVVTAVSLAALWQVPAIVRAQDSRSEALALFEEIISRFPDRKTSSYEASQFLSFAAAYLAGEGWFPSITDYRAVMKSLSDNKDQTTYLSLSGQNLVAFSSQTPPEIIDLLVVAPYDTLTPDDAGSLPTRPYTAEASASLLSLASEMEPSARQSVALAFVSGHHQLGAGAQALLGMLDERGFTVRSALVLGDMYSSSYLPLVANNHVALESVRASYDSAKAAGLRPHVAGPRDSTWYEAVSSAPPGTPTVDSILGTANFPGEGSVFVNREIPALTVGFPRGGHLPTEGPHAPGTPEPGRVSKVLSTLTSLVQGGPLAEGTPDHLVNGGFAGPFDGDTAVFQPLDHLAMVEKKTVSLAGMAMCAIGVLVLVFHRHLLNARGLALTGGITLAALASFTVGGALFSSGSGRYAAWTFPMLPLSVVTVLFAGLILLGFLRIWNVKSRIAYLHKKAYPPAPAHGPGQGTNAPGDDVRTTAGAWGLTVMLAVTVGTGFTGSPFFPYALASALLMCLAVIIEGIRLSCRPSLGAWVWVNRAFYLAPLAAAVLWAGSPADTETLILLGTGLTRLSPETLASLLSVAASSASLISTFRLPKAVEKGRGLLLVAELITLAGMLLAVFTLPKVTVGSLPKHVIAYESYDADPRVMLASPAAVTQVTAGPVQAGEGSEEFRPVFVADKSGIQSAALPPVSASDWAVIELTRLETKTGVAFRATLPERPTFLALDVMDTMRTRTGSTPAAVTEILGIDAMLGVSAEDDGSSEPAKLQPGNSIRLIWWYPPEFMISKEFGLNSRSIVSVELRAVYVGRSYLGLSLDSPEASFVNVTEVAESLTVR